MNKRKPYPSKEGSDFKGKSKEASFKGKPKRREVEKSEKPQPEHESGLPTALRLNRYIANSGVCSRREADSLIAKGLVTVNGKVVTEMGTQVKRSDDIRYEGKKLNPEAKVYILINKPKDMVTTTSDPEGRRTVLDLVEEACLERVYPVGRLDRNTTGVLLLTNDGDLSKKLTHPSSEIKKIYHVFLDRPVSKQHMDDIRKGIELEDGSIKPDVVSYADTNDHSQVGIEIHSGRNRIVRRIFEHLGYRVEKLDRVYFAGLTKKTISRGKWRFLTNDEVKFLKAGILK
ncbi:pseudouridine synthase [Geofilum rubicundum]|uniref:Pseudouridine synthase n=1 Tax=Geofilum rubicundum JCM 15548 TaxID=1236989 RepID=A0A0E9M2N4_9BACT|nr:pseudouridine synthase [Geofilum rubicundum]GAO31789.1 ribosomal large subunit pseudouridine synthase B [Geofilum rubicundum JCM 15548]